MSQHLGSLWAQAPVGEQVGQAVGIVFLAAASILYLAGFWRVFQKAGQPGWTSLVPGFNLWMLLKIVGRPGWWLLLLLIPPVNVVVAITVLNDLSRVFGKGTTHTLGLIFLWPVFVTLLGLSDARYQPHRL